MKTNCYQYSMPRLNALHIIAFGVWRMHAMTDTVNLAIYEEINRALNTLIY